MLTPPDLSFLQEATLTSWLVSLGLECGDEATLLDRYCERLVAESIPIIRVSTGSAALDPTLEASGISWSRAGGIQREEYTHAESDTRPDFWLGSPFYQLLERGLKELRRRVGDDYRKGEFELMDRLVQQDGMSDYLAILVDYGTGTTGRSAVKVISLSRPGIRSCFPARFGTQKEWMTSAEDSSSRTGRPAGRPGRGDVTPVSHPVVAGVGG